MTSNYNETEKFFDEMLDANGDPRQGMERLTEWMLQAPRDLLKARQAEAKVLFRRIGITFAVYGEGGDPERLIPFDIVPRVLRASEWEFLSKGIKQRVKALNMFIHDVYHKGEILAAGKILNAWYCTTRPIYRSCVALMLQAMCIHISPELI